MLGGRRQYINEELIKKKTKETSLTLPYREDWLHDAKF